MTETVRRYDDLARTIAKLQRRVDSLPTHSHGVIPHAVVRDSIGRTATATATVPVQVDTTVVSRGVITPVVGGVNRGIQVDREGSYVVAAVVQIEPNATSIIVSATTNGTTLHTEALRSTIETSATGQAHRIPIAGSWFFAASDLVGVEVTNNEAVGRTIQRAALTVTRIGK